MTALPADRCLDVEEVPRGTIRRRPAAATCLRTLAGIDAAREARARSTRATVHLRSREVAPLLRRVAAR